MERRGNLESSQGSYAFLLGNKRDIILIHLVTLLQQKYHQLGSNMSQKFHFLNSEIDYFQSSFEAVNDENRERSGYFCDGTEITGPHE